MKKSVAAWVIYRVKAGAEPRPALTLYSLPVPAVMSTSTHNLHMSARADELLAIADAISRGEIPEYQHNECFTSGAFDLLLVNVHGPEAYELLINLCERFVTLHTQGHNIAGFYGLLSQVARQTNTTEMPPQMHPIIDAHAKLSGELKAWYRHGSQISV